MTTLLKAFYHSDVQTVFIHEDLILAEINERIRLIKYFEEDDWDIGRPAITTCLHQLVFCDGRYKGQWHYIKGEVELL